MNVLITGSASYIAQNLILELKKKNINFIGIDLENKKNSSDYLKLDITKHKEFAKLNNKKIDSIIHLAAISNDRDAKKNPVKCYNVNFKGTLNLIKFANQSNVKTFTFASTEWVYEKSKHRVNSVQKELNFFDLNNQYSATKLLGEEVIKSQINFKYCILRFGIIYGNRFENFSAIENIAATLKKQNKVNIGSKKTLRSFIHVDDVVKSILLSLKIKNNCSVDVQGPDKKNLGEIINLISKILKKKISNKKLEKNKPSIRNVKISKKIDHLNWKPNITIMKGLLKFYNEYK